MTVIHSMSQADVGRCRHSGGASVATVAALAAAVAFAVALALSAPLPAAQVLWLLLFAPALEEVVFRAGLHEAMLQRASVLGLPGLLGANLVTAIAFAAAHVAHRADALAALTLLPALVIGALYQRQRRIAPCIALHALFNAGWMLWP